MGILLEKPYQKQVVGQLARIERDTGTAFMFHVVTEHNLRLLLAAENGDRSLSAQKAASTARTGLIHPTAGHISLVSDANPKRRMSQNYSGQKPRLRVHPDDYHKFIEVDHVIVKEAKPAECRETVKKSIGSFNSQAITIGAWPSPHHDHI